MDNTAYSVICETRFIQATRETGYRSTATAVSELIDNAIQAEATQIQIVVAKEKACNDPECVKHCETNSGHNLGSKKD